MSLPEIKDIAGGYSFKWNSADNVQIRATRLHSNNEGEVKGELDISTSAPGYSPHLFLGRFNFNGIKARKELVNHLKPIYDIDWEQIIEQLVVYTLERVRRGEPVQEIFVTDEKVCPPEYILEPFLIRNYPTVFFGDPSSFKSSMAVVVAGCIVLPWDDNPLRLTAPANPIKVLILDWETDYATFKYQISCFQRGMGLPSIPVSYRRCSLPLYNDLEQIQNAIADTGAEVIIVDSLGLACGGELNEAGTAIQFFTALRQLKVSSLLLAHTAKNRDNSKKSIYGSVYFEAQSRSVWQLIKKQEKGANELDLAMKNTKSPPFRKPYQDLGFHIAFSEDSMEVRTCDPKSVAEFLETMGTQDRVLALIKEEPISPMNIATTLGITPVNARQVCMNLKKKNLIIKLPNSDNYAIASDKTDEELS